MFEERKEYEKTTSKSFRKEASKLYEYVNTVERSLQSCEILQAVAWNSKSTEIQGGDKTKSEPVFDEERVERLRAAGLKELKRVSLSFNKVKVIMSVLIPINSERNMTSVNLQEAGKSDKSGLFATSELVIAFVDDCGAESILRLCSQNPSYLELESVGVVDEDVSIQPTILELSLQALEQLGEFVLPVETFLDENSTSVKLKSRSEKDKECDVSSDKLLANKLKRKSGRKTQKIKNLQVSEFSQSNDVVKSTNLKSTADTQLHVASCGLTIPLKLRVIGHSVGGAVAAYASMLLDGTLRPKSDQQPRSRMFIGLYHEKVRCIALGPPPCVSRVLVPRFVTSLICGDDIIPRATKDTLAHLKKRVLDYLNTQSSALGWVPGASFLGDMASLAGKGIAQYASGSHDMSSLQVPGRVFFMRSRSHKNGASFQRVFRGNWREDMLWMLHDILLSKKILLHHSIDSYTQTLFRC